MRKSSIIIRDIAEIISIYFEKRVPRAAAALSYSIVFSLFPFLMCFSAMLGSLNITDQQILNACSGIIPSEAIEVISAYFGYVSQYDATTIFFTALAVTVTSSSASFRTLLNVMADINGETKHRDIFRWILSFVLSFVFLGVIYLSCVVVVSGRWFLNMVNTYVNISFIPVSFFTDLWKWVRFLILFILLFLVIYGAYMLSAPSRRERKVPCGRGALFASIVLVAASIIFSKAISYSSKYTLIYGSLASIIVLLLWLNTSSCVLILGNIVNAVIYRNHPAKMKETQNKYEREDKQTEVTTSLNDENLKKEEITISSGEDKEKSEIVVDK